MYLLIALLLAPVVVLVALILGAWTKYDSEGLPREKTKD